MTRVLIADDDVDVGQSLKEYLSAAGFDAVVVAEAADILDVARRQPPDVILQDVHMPGLDLERHVQRVRADDKLHQARLVIFTATFDAEELADRSHADAYLSKPFDPASLLKLLQELTSTTRAT